MGYTPPGSPGGPPTGANRELAAGTVRHRGGRHVRALTMTAALTFSPGQALAFAIVIGLIILTIIWGLFEGEHDRVQREKQRQLKREIRRQP